MLNLRQHLLLLPIFVPLIVILAMARPAHSAGSNARDTKGGHVMMLLNQAATMGFENYRPAYVIQAVNALQPLERKGVRY